MGGMLLETVVDISGLVVIVLLCMCAFIQLFAMVDTAHTTPEVIQVTYLTFLLGAFDLEADFGHGGLIMKFGFFLLTFVGTILVSNILIASISDTYERIVDRQELEDVKDRASLILRIGALCPQPRHLVFATPQTASPDEWRGRITEIKRHINSLQVALSMQVQQLQESQQELQESQQKLQESQQK